MINNDITYLTMIKNEKNIERCKFCRNIGFGGAMLDMTVVILTFNEEKNIGICISSVKKIAKRIVVIDSGSTDKTKEIAEKLGADVYIHEWVNYSNQYNWGIENAGITTKWIFRLDADESLTEASAREIENICMKNDHTNVNGIIVRFKVTFLGKDLKHGGIYPFRKLLVYKRDKGFMEKRNMDEHIVLSEGRAVELRNDSIHKDFKDLTFWIDKHNKYSNREMQDYLDSEGKEHNVLGLTKYAKIKRFIKFRIYYNLPIGFRAHLYYIYRFYILGGFLDGKEGHIFAFLQAYWYRYLVDAKIYEHKLSMRSR